MTKNIIAKDPIDFIRKFTFATYQHNAGSTAFSTRTEKGLIIRLNDNVYPMCVEVELNAEQHKTAEVIANWLEKQPLFFVQPYASVPTQDGTNVTLLIININSFDAKPVVIKSHLDDIIAMMDRTRALMRGGETSCRRPSYEPDPADQYNQNQGFGNHGQVIGRIVLDNVRTPVMQTPRGPKSSGGNNNW